MGKRRTTLLLGALVLGMVGLSFASVPLYRVFCQVTGYGGTPRTGITAPADQAVTGPPLTILFNADLAAGMPWRFQPVVSRLHAPSGQPVLAVFRVENLADHEVVGTSTFNVTPMKAAPYVSKMECFCFTEQRLKAHEKAELPVQFIVDPAIATDPETQDVKTITLSYTFFQAKS